MRGWILGISLLAAQAALAADVPAVLQWSQRVELSTPVSGVVQSVNVNVGDTVKKGQTLLTLDAGAYQARVAETQAAIGRLREDAADAKRNLDRTQELYDRTVIATTELDAAKLRDARAKGMLAEAQARLRLEQKNVADSTVRAPFDGVVVARQVEPGQTVASGLQPQTLLVVARASEMLARMKLYDNQLAKLKVGQEVGVEVGGQSYAGRIKALGMEPVVAKDEVTYPVDVVFPVKEQLRAGTPAKVKLP